MQTQTQVQKKDDPSLDQKDLEEAFSDHDKDGSGALSLSEWQTPFEETVQSMLNDGDADHLTEEERVAHHRQEFNSFDSNGDGFLDEKELDALAKQVSAGHAEQGVAEHGNVSGADVMQALDLDADGKVTFEVRLYSLRIGPFNPTIAHHHGVRRQHSEHPLPLSP
jgi:Ca2+-binding EF-hand superfamily protein